VTTSHPSYVLLATDGAPNCNPSLSSFGCRCVSPPGAPICSPGNCLDDVATDGVIDELLAAGIKVYVVGIAASEWRDVLDTMARRGGTGSAILADDPATIEAAFAEIAGSVISCDYEIGEPDPSADPNLINFYFDGVAVPFDNDGECDDGWAWSDDAHTRMRFCGSYCERLARGMVGTANATYGCPTIW
jgi:hypothetical protein